MPTPEASEARKQAAELLQNKAATCVVVQHGRIVYTASGRGVAPLRWLYENEPEKLRGAFVMDTVIGKAAAMLLVLGGAKEVYGVVMSESGRAFLEQNGIAAEHGRRVAMIRARDGQGMCPLEKSVIGTDDPVEGYRRITATIAQLMAQSN